MAAKKKSITVEDLWQIERLAAISLSPDGAQAVATVTRHSMEDNKSFASLWLLSTLGGDPRLLTACGEKDGQPQWSPRGDRIAFVAKREQEGTKDEEAQLYLIAPDGGEAQRIVTVATGVEAFRWFPDGRRIAFVSWVWPELNGAKAQAKRHAEFAKRKETGYVTSEAQYRFWDHQVPMGRAAHLHVLDVDSGKLQDLFEGTPYELTRADPDNLAFDISPDGKRIVFAFDPAAQKQIDNRFALAEVDLKSGKVKTLVQDDGWDCHSPRYSPEGQRIAFLASHQAITHTMPQQVAIWDRETGEWSPQSGEWDHDAQAPLLWDDDGLALLCRAEQRGRMHLWRWHLPERRAEVIVAGGWVQAFDQRGGTLVSLADSMLHPARAHVHLAAAESRRIDRFNDKLLESLELGTREEVLLPAPAGEVQLWLAYPPGFDAKKRYPILHTLHGGPHAASGDTWHYRWNMMVFAAGGYVVAAINYHGSSGFGHAFLDSISKRWGELELQDIEAATDWLLAHRWADRKRVFAAGGSYGGYLVAWMNGHVAPGRYAAYVCHAGCYDWTAMFADDAYTWHAKELGAWYWDDAAKIASQSPHTFASAMQTPTLVVHGAKDYRVPDQQGIAYYNTLKAKGVDARLLWFPDENHWVLQPRNSRLWYEEFFAWLQRHDPQRQDVTRGIAKAKPRPARSQ